MLTPEEISALYLSAKVGLFATLVNLPFAIFVAWILARYEFRLKVILESLLQLPMILPPVVLGYLLLILFGNRGIVGQFLSEWGIQLAFNWKGAVIASMVVAFPLMVQPIRLSFQLINQQLEQIAQTLGASPIQAFFRLVCRLPCLVYLLEVFLCFSRSLGEFGATITFVGNIPDETRTVPIAIYSLLQQPDGESMAMRLVLLSVGLAFAALVANHLILKRYQQRLTP